MRDFNARQNRSEATKVTFLAKIKTITQLVAISTYLLGLALSNMLIVLIADILLFLSFLQFRLILVFNIQIIIPSIRKSNEVFISSLLLFTLTSHNSPWFNYDDEISYIYSGLQKHSEISDIRYSAAPNSLWILENIKNELNEQSMSKRMQTAFI